MKSARLILTLVIVLALALRASALDQMPACNAELVQRADLIGSFSDRRVIDIGRPLWPT